jgi:predicted nucleotide-binding protein
MSALLLLVARDQAQQRLETRVDKGRELLGEPLQDMPDCQRVSEAMASWHQYNVELLRQMFSDGTVSGEYAKPLSYLGGVQTLPQRIQSIHRDIERLIGRLTGILERLELYQVATSASPTTAANPPAAGVAARDSVFIVHGHGHREDEVARFIEGRGGRPIILKDEIHGGSTTLVEKLEREAGKCGYAVVLFTPDDVGMKARSDEKLKPRARQNVILELGYFIAKLGRGQVTILGDPTVEIPSDFGGVGYYVLDDGGGWKLSLGDELRQAKMLNADPPAGQGPGFALPPPLTGDFGDGPGS